MFSANLRGAFSLVSSQLWLPPASRMFLVNTSGQSLDSFYLWLPLHSFDLIPCRYMFVQQHMWRSEIILGHDSLRAVYLGVICWDKAHSFFCQEFTVYAKLSDHWAVGIHLFLHPHHRDYKCTAPNKESFTCLLRLELRALSSYLYSHLSSSISILNTSHQGRSSSSSTESSHEDWLYQQIPCFQTGHILKFCGLWENISAHLNKLIYAQSYKWTTTKNYDLSLQHLLLIPLSR